MLPFAEWSRSFLKTPIIYITICITIPSMALYIAQIVTIVRHKKFHNSFYALFVMRAIPDWLGVFGSFYSYRFPVIIGALLYPIYTNFPNWMYGLALLFTEYTFQANNLVTILMLLNRLSAIIMPMKHEKLWRKLLPFLTIFVYCMPIITCWPVFKMKGAIRMVSPNSTTDYNFSMAEAGDGPYLIYITYVCTVFSVIFMILCVLINIATFVAYKQHLKKVRKNGSNNGDEIEKKLLIYALATFLGHFLFASLYLVGIVLNSIDPPTMPVIFIYHPLIMDTGTVVLSSWLLLWASGIFRQQLLKDFGIIRINNVQTIRVNAPEGPRNNKHWATNVSHQHTSSVQQMPTVS